MNRKYSIKTNINQLAGSKGYLNYMKTQSSVFISPSFSLGNLPNIYYTRVRVNRNIKDKHNKKSISIINIDKYINTTDIKKYINNNSNNK